MPDKSGEIFLSCKEMAAMAKSGSRISGTYAHWNPDGEECTHADCAKKDRQNVWSSFNEFVVSIARYRVSDATKAMLEGDPNAGGNIVPEKFADVLFSSNIVMICGHCGAMEATDVHQPDCCWASQLEADEPTIIERTQGGGDA